MMGLKYMMMFKEGGKCKQITNRQTDGCRKALFSCHITVIILA